ncbi:MAG: hypothetical protein K2K34_05195, partial [Oscillospiraceae bacterium]|nr:hypothetical protein [Oscillospiraceae bacterium]
SFGGASCSAAAPVKRKKLTEKEWKRQLEAKAAFEAAEKEAERAEIERRFNNLEIGARLSDNSIVTDIETDEDGSIAYIYTKSTFSDWAVYDVEDFWDGVISFEEISEPEQPDENQITFDEIAAYSANDTAAMTAPTSPIDEAAAKRGHESYSFSEYKAGSATAAYNAADKVQERIKNRSKPNAPPVTLPMLSNKLYMPRMTDCNIFNV